MENSNSTTKMRKSFKRHLIVSYTLFALVIIFIFSNYSSWVHGDCPIQHEDNCECIIHTTYQEHHYQKNMFTPVFRTKRPCNCEICSVVNDNQLATTSLMTNGVPQHRVNCQYVECVLNHDNCNNCICECPPCNVCNNKSNHELLVVVIILMFGAAGNALYFVPDYLYDKKIKNKGGKNE